MSQFHCQCLISSCLFPSKVIVSKEMYSSTNRESTSRAPSGQYASYASNQPSGANYSYMGSGGGGPGQGGRSTSSGQNQDPSSNSSFGFNSFGFPSFNVQNLTQSFSNNFNPSSFSSFIPGQQASSAAQSNPRPSGPSRSQSTSSAESPEKYCEHCCTKFNYFKRRVSC